MVKRFLRIIALLLLLGLIPLLPWLILVSHLATAGILQPEIATHRRCRLHADAADSPENTTDSYYFFTEVELRMKSTIGTSFPTSALLLSETTTASAATAGFAPYRCFHWNLLLPPAIDGFFSTLIDCTKSMTQEGRYEIIKKAIIKVGLRHKEHIAAYEHSIVEC
ncbi:hypothetical protein Tco_1430287 [Tanacetum coccineum]